MLLLTRDQFRERVFARDNYKCVICKQPAQDAHHIMERRLFPDGGYYLDNGASLCGDDHIKAEQTVLSCDEIRRAAGITKVILPPHLYHDQEYDKWGNPILSNGTRLKGDLFEDGSVQKILAPVLGLFTDKVKYPRTYHLPFSPGVGKDDRVMTDMGIFTTTEIVVTEKMDGENTTLYPDYIHARALDYSPHESRNWSKVIWSQIAHEIPENHRICCENLYAKHSIMYEDLKGYLYMFSMWDDRNFCLSWDETEEWAGLLGLPLVPVLFRGDWDVVAIHHLALDVVNRGGEGIVVRTTDEFHYSNFRKCVAKYVRKDHVQTHAHWMNQRVVPNKLSSNG